MLAPLLRVQSNAILPVETTLRTAGLAFEIEIQNLCVMAGRKQIRCEKSFFERGEVISTMTVAVGRTVSTFVFVLRLNAGDTNNPTVKRSEQSPCSLKSSQLYYFC